MLFSSRFPVKTIIRLTRAWNLLIIILAQYCAAVFLISESILTDYRMFLLSLSTVFIAAAGYVINDYFDIKIDLINKPAEVMVGQSITRRSAIFLHSLFSAGGVLSGLMISWKVALLNLLSSMLLWWYSARLKRMPFSGNLAVATLTGFSILILYLVYPQANHTIWLYSVFAFIMTLIREAVKDMEDLEGDKAFDCQTLPIVWGIAGTKRYVGMLILFLMLSTFLVHFYLQPLPVLYFLGFIFLPMAWFSYRMIQADTVREYHELSSWSKFIMLTGILSMTLMA